MNTRVRILTDLAHGGWVCGADWYRDFTPTFSQRISEVNAEVRAGTGEDRIESRVCRRHEHRGTIHEYRDTFAVKPRQLSLSATFRGSGV